MWVLGEGFNFFIAPGLIPLTQFCNPSNLLFSMISPRVMEVKGV